MTCKQVAEAVITTYLGSNQTPDGIYDIYEIRAGNKKVLLEHMKALKNIFEEAIKEIESEIHS